MRTAFLALVLAAIGCVPSELGDLGRVRAAEAGDVEAQRQLANEHKPGHAFGVATGDVLKAVYWYRKSCALGYANAQTDFYDFASVYAQTTDPQYLDEAFTCLNQAIDQGHRNGAARTA